MNYRSIGDLSAVIRANLYRLPPDIDLVVGIPRSGLLAANIIALHLNLRVTDLDSSIVDAPLRHGSTRHCRFAGLGRPSEAKHVLVVDDSIDSGGSMAEVRRLVESAGRSQKVTYCAVYATPGSIDKVDVYFDVVRQFRIFEWNIMHREFLSRCCVDIDGVICVDPTDEENDDGANYLKFLDKALPLTIPTYPVGCLVTSRLEKYRVQTARWLAAHGVIYNELQMLDLPDAETRRRLGCHAAFKAKVYRKLRTAELFIESEPEQASEIARTAGKPVVSFKSQELFLPGFSYAFAETQVYRLPRRIANKAYRVVKRLIRSD